MPAWVLPIMSLIHAATIQAKRITATTSRLSTATGACLLQVDFDEFCALMLGQDVQDGQGFFNAMFKTQRETGAMFTTVRG